MKNLYKKNRDFDQKLYEQMNQVNKNYEKYLYFKMLYIIKNIIEFKYKREGNHKNNYSQDNKN